MPRYELCDCTFRPDKPSRVCAFCGNLTMLPPDTGCLSNSDVDSDTVAVSNLRVWRETHADSEGSLWRMRHGGYGSQWVEVRPEILAMDTRCAAYERAESLGLTGLTSIVDSLCALASYPVLDDDDHSEVGMEEEREHWESYGRFDFERAIENEIGEVCDMETLMERAQGTFKGQRFDGFESTDDLVRFVMSNADCYPEKIDSSAYDFKIKADRWRPSPSGVGKLVEGALTCLGFPWHGPVTLAQHVESLSWGSPERAVWNDLRLETEVSGPQSVE